MVGAALVRALEARGFERLILRAKGDLDLRQAGDVARFFAETKPEYVFLAAAKVGGIWANASYPADFLYDNLAIETNVIHQAHVYGVKKLLLLGSSCIYPRNSPQPIKEEYLLTGSLEPTNEWYAVAKIAGIKLCEAYRRQHGNDFIAAMPTNLYGPHDNFDLETSHVLPALLRKFHESKETGVPPVLWGSGRPRREFLHVDDCAEACLFLMEHYSGDMSVNVGVGMDIPIAELAQSIARIVGYEGPISWDASKPDGVPRKVLDCSRLTALGWEPKIALTHGIAGTYAWFREHAAAPPAQSMR